jgi:hypothetical protein
MKKKSTSRSAFLNPRVLISCAFCAIGLLVSLLAFAFYPGGNALAAPRPQQDQLALPAVPSAPTATITVQSLADGPANAANCPGAGCRLRDAIAAAALGDTIDFSVTGVITLNSGQLEVDKDLTIDGPGVLALAVDGNLSSRLFHIQSGKTVIISGLTVQNGKVSYPQTGGGGIYNDIATLTLMNCVIAGNSTVGGAGGGGGIYNLNGTLTLVDCTITDNIAEGNGPQVVNGIGGGISSDARGGSRDAILTLRNCTVSSNLATASGGAFGSFGATATNLVATAVSSTQINLTWTDNATNETNYRVQRSLDGINFSFIPGTLPANSTSYSDTGRSPNTTYYYRVGSFNSCGFSPNSNVASATTPP